MSKRERLFILMLEDDSDDRYITESTFAENGFDIRLEFVTKPEEVVQYLSKCGREKGTIFPDLILLDRHTPAGSSFDVLQQIKTADNYKRIPVVVISGSNFTHDVDEAYALGAKFLHSEARHCKTND